MILQTLLSWFTGGGFKGIAEELNEAYQARLNAANDADKISADVRMNLVQARVAAQTQGAGSVWAKIVRACFAAPFIIYVWKLVVWDKVLGYGATDDLSSDLWRVLTIIIAFYFLDNTIRMVRR